MGERTDGTGRDARSSGLQGKGAPLTAIAVREGVDETASNHEDTASDDRGLTAPAVSNRGAIKTTRLASETAKLVAKSAAK